MRGLLCGAVMLTLLAGAGCKGGDAARRSSVRTTQESARAIPPAGPAAQDSLRESAMEDRLSRMATAPDSELAAELPEYRQATRAILEDFRIEMTDKKLDSPEWRRMLAALADDLSRMEKMSPAELRAFWPQHSHRVHDLLSLHAWMNGRVQDR